MENISNFFKNSWKRFRYVLSTIIPQGLKELWDSFLRTLPFWLIILGLIFIGLEFSINNDYVALKIEKFPAQLIRLFLSLGRPLLIGGVFGSLLKTYQYLGVFRDTVKEAIFEKPWFDEKHLRELWKKISSALYQDKFPQELNSFLHETILEKYFPTNKQFYYSVFELSCIFSWKGNNKKIIQREEILYKKVVPFDQHAKIILPFKFENPQGNNQETQLRLEKLTVNGTDRGQMFTIREADGKTVAEYNIPLEGEAEYVVERKLITEFSIDDEPFANFTSRNFIESVRVEVYTKEPDLKIQFLPIGTWEDFRIVGHDLPYKFAREYNNLMFPNQGFILVFSKTS